MLFKYFNLNLIFSYIILTNSAMNQLDTKLPVIDERTCTFAVLEYEINQILKEFDCSTDINDIDDKTVSYIYKKLNVVHNQIKILKAKYKIAETERKDAERRALVYKEEIDMLTDHLDRKMDVTSSLDSEWNESEKHWLDHDSDEEGFSNRFNNSNIDFNNSNVDFSRNLIADYAPVERKSQLFKQSIPDSPTPLTSPKNNDQDLLRSTPVVYNHQPTNDEIQDMLGLSKPNTNEVLSSKTGNKTKTGNFSFYPMAFLYSNNLIANKYFKHLTPPIFHNVPPVIP